MDKKPRGLCEPGRDMTRRGVLTGLLACGAGFNAGFSTAASAAGTEQAVPNSAGSVPPLLDAPAGACDCHHHIYDSRFPVSPHWKTGAMANAGVADYRLLQKRLGTTRSVVVQPRHTASTIVASWMRSLNSEPPRAASPWSTPACRTLSINPSLEVYRRAKA